MFFAYYCFFFFRANLAECDAMKFILNTYETALGQAINYEKSGIFFSKNVDQDTQEILSARLRVSNPLNTGRHLGLPSMIGRKNNEVFGNLKDQLWNKINSYGGKFLSEAGREVLIKYVCQALPIFCMNVFLLALSLTDRLQKMMNSFW